MKQPQQLLLLFSLLTNTFSCSSQEKVSFPSGYSMATGVETKLDNDLEEISGIAWDEESGRFLAEEDEDGDVYFLNSKYEITDKQKFGKSGDYEDIELVGKKLYVLRSDGDIMEMNYENGKVTEAQQHKYQGEKAEFESLYKDPRKQQLILLCKNYKDDHKKEAVLGYAFSLPDHHYSKNPVVEIPWKNIEKQYGHSIKHFHPSAAAINPISGELYILASIERLLVVVSGTQNIKSVTHLKGSDFVQPEGLTFDNHGNMYITNEGAGGKPTLWFFPYQKS